MTLRLYNTLTRSKEDFRPLDAGNVRVYVCGPTVYDFAHIGNARPVVVFDVLFRLLRHVYGTDHVTYVRNITDVDDKINARAARDFPDLPLNEAIGRVTEGTLRQFHADVAALGCLEPTVEPRATGHIDDMKAMIERLVEKDCAYVADDHVLFHVAAMPDYGVLSNRSLDEMLAGARVEVAPYKRDAMDFVLWKPSSPGEPAWPSPCGIEAPGRPGWHIECSAMARKHLGDTFDIHGGGIDLMFPHHENELAQSRCALGVERMASVWMHNGFLQVEGRKMAKSEGNFVTIRELLHEWRGYAWPGEALRFNLLRTHYRQPMNWTYQGLDEAHDILWNWYGELVGVKPAPAVPEQLISALGDDLNTPAATTVLHDLRREGEKEGLLSALRFLGFSGELRKVGRAAVAIAQSGKLSVKGQALLAAVTASGKLTANELADEAASRGNVVSKEQIETRIAARNEARKAQNWAEADRIRDELAAMGIELHDTKDGTSWEVRR